MNPRTDDQIMDAIAADFIPETTDITQKVTARLASRPRAVRRVRAISLALLALSLTAIVLFATVPEAASAVRQVFGFLPPAGMIDRSADVRVLQGPISHEKNGVTVTVEQVVALPDRTVIQYKVSGIPPSAYPQHLPGSDPLGFQKACMDPLFIRLPDGTALTHTGYNALSGNVGVPEYETNFMLKSIPSGVDEITLVMPCIEGTERDAIPGDWEFTLHLLNRPDRATLLGVQELPSPAPADTGTAHELPANLPSENSIRPSNSDIQFILDKAVELPDGDQLYGRLQWGKNVPYSAMSLDSYELVDVQGQRIPITQISPDPGQMPAPGSRVIPLAFKVHGPVQHPGLTTLKVDRLTAFLPVKDAHFTFDTGLALDANQQWPLDQYVQAGPYFVRVVSAARLADGYQFTFQADPEIGCVDVSIQGTDAPKGKCEQGTSSVQFDGEAPFGKLTIIITNLDVSLSGSWQATWLPPEAARMGASVGK